jgi:hypothetical protein
MIKFRMLPIGQRRGVSGYSFVKKKLHEKYSSDIVTGLPAMQSNEQASHRMHEKPR